jgi:hypothetical protein
MGIFSPVKKNANKFRYIPRYYDPEKERRDMRRMELCGTSSKDSGEYVPGQYIRTQREARRTAKAASETKSRRPSTMLLILAGLAIVAIVLYPRLASLKMTKQVSTEQQDDMAAYKHEAELEALKENRETYQQYLEDVAWPHRHVKTVTIVSNDSKEEY